MAGKTRRFAPIINERKHLPQRSVSVDVNRRRALLVGGSCLSGLLSGCLGGSPAPAETSTKTTTRTASPTSTPTATETPSYDCDTAYRPPAPSANDDPPGETDRYRYPERPASLADESAVVSYVESYERAYRLNDLRSEHGSDLVHAGVFQYETWVHETTADAAIVRVKYAFGYGIERDDGQVEADSPTIYASYAVDGDAVLRAVERGYQEDESGLDPDPVEAGSVVECF